MKKGEFFECRTETGLERNRDEEPTSEELASDVEAFLKAGGQIETVNNHGKQIAEPKQELQVNKLAKGWISNHFPRSIAMSKAKNAGISFKLVIKERERIIARSRQS